MTSSLISQLRNIRPSSKPVPRQQNKRAGQRLKGSFQRTHKVMPYGNLVFLCLLHVLLHHCAVEGPDIHVKLAGLRYPREDVGGLATSAEGEEYIAWFSNNREPA